MLWRCQLARQLSEGSASKVVNPSLTWLASKCLLLAGNLHYLLHGLFLRVTRVPSWCGSWLSPEQLIKREQGRSPSVFSDMGSHTVISEMSYWLHRGARFHVLGTTQSMNTRIWELLVAVREAGYLPQAEPIIIPIRQMGNWDPTDIK